jgi:hypothetical protein
MGVSFGKLIVGYVSGFTIYALEGDAQPQSEYKFTHLYSRIKTCLNLLIVWYFCLSELVNADDPNLNFITNNPVDALLAVEIEPSKEYLLCFNRKLTRLLPGNHWESNWMSEWVGNRINEWTSEWVNNFVMRKEKSVKRKCAWMI